MRRSKQMEVLIHLKSASEIKGMMTSWINSISKSSQKRNRHSSSGFKNTKMKTLKASSFTLQVSYARNL